MTRDEACKALGFGPGATLSAEDVRSRHRMAAAVHHPDLGGSVEEMARANEARDVLLAELEPPKGARCVCVSPFKRNPLCKAMHEEPDGPAPAPQPDDEQGEPCVCRGFHRNPMCRARH